MKGKMIFEFGEDERHHPIIEKLLEGLKNKSGVCGRSELVPARLTIRDTTINLEVMRGNVDFAADKSTARVMSIEVLLRDK